MVLRTGARAISAGTNAYDAGAKENFSNTEFAAIIGAAREKDKLQFNERYFKETAALAVLWRAVEKIVSSQPRYNSCRAIVNVTQWCKQALCRTNFKKEMAIAVPDEFMKFMEDKGEVKNAQKYARADQKIFSGLQAQEQILKFNGQTWQKISVRQTFKNSRQVARKRICTLKRAVQLRAAF